jgi:hypothetical protein
MAFSTEIQAQIAFKNLLGKSQTRADKGPVSEGVGIGFDIPSSNIMMDQLGPTPSDSVAAGIAVQVTATLTVDPESNGFTYFTYWPASAPSGTDIRNSNQPFAYGVGSLEGISANQRITNIISDSFGSLYQAQPFDSNGNDIKPLDAREWIYQYNSGVFFQSFVSVNGVAVTTPATVKVYYYIGAKLLDQTKNQQTNIRVTATGSVNVAQDIYFATYSTPMISTYSTNYLFLVDFNKTNLSSTVSLNINSIGTYSVRKYTAEGPVPLSPGDILGATGGTSGQIYYLIYNNGIFEFYTKNPVSNPGFFTQPTDTTFAVGGIDRGTQFDKVSVQDMFKDLLYPELLGRINSFVLTGQSGVVNSVEVGGFLTNLDYNVSWTLTNPSDFKDGTLRVEDVTNVSSVETYWKNPTNQPFTQSAVIVSPFTFSFGGTVSTTTSNTRTLKVSIQRNNGTVVSKFLDIPWIWKVYYGSSTFSSLTSSQIFALNSTLSTQSVGTWTISGTQGYKYIAFPDDLSYDFSSVYLKGLPLVLASGTVSGYTFSYGDVTYTTVTVSNANNVSKKYKLYRSKYEIGATISVNINK